MKTPCAIPLFSLVCLLTVLAQAGNSSLTNSHARRSIERAHQHHKRAQHAGPRRLEEERDVVLDQIIKLADGTLEDVKVVVNDAGSTVSVIYPSTTTSTTSSTDSASTTSVTSTSSTSTSSDSSSSSTSTSTTDTSTASSASDTASSTSNSATSTGNSSSSATDSATSGSVTQTPAPTVTDPPTSTTDSVSATITDPPASSSSCAVGDVGCLAQSLTSGAGSAVSSVVSQVTSAVLQSDTPTTTGVAQTTDVTQSTDSSSPTATPTDTPTSTTDAPASTSDVISDVLSSLTSALQTTTDSPATQTQSDSSTPTQTDKPTSDSTQPTATDSGSISQVTQTITATQTQSYSDSYVDTKTLTASDSPTDSGTATVTQTASVSFPTLTNSPTDSDTTTATATDSNASETATDSLATLSITTQAIPSEYSYITESSLELTSIQPTATLSLTLTDPDAAFTTASITQSGTDAPSASAIPTQIPTRIFPATRLDPNDPALAGMSLVSLKFLNGLTWSFVSNNANTAALLFVYTPQTLANALGISADQVLTYAMQAYAPANYNGDVSQLATVYLLYLPADQVDTLQQQLLTSNSPLYTNQAGIPKQISAQLDASFPVDAVTLNTAIVGTGNTASSNNVDAADASSASRRDAIIGVCAAFGVILLAVVLWWGYKSWKRREEKAHRRLTYDSAGMHQAGGYGATTQTAHAYGGVYGAAPQRSAYPQPHTPLYTTHGGQQDPIANPFDDSSYEDDYETRRRSFFYAEDSLRGYTMPREEDQGITYTQLRQQQQGLMPHDGKRRAPIQASAISAPILRESSLNW